jgi:hypothetical protein
MQEWLLNSYTPGFDASELACKCLLGLIKSLPVGDLATLRITMQVLTDRFMVFSLCRLQMRFSTINIDDPLGNSCVDMAAELNRANEIYATKYMELTMHWTNLWVLPNDTFDEYGNKTLLALVILKGLYTLVHSMLRKDSTMVKSK